MLWIVTKTTKELKTEKRMLTKSTHTLEQLRKVKEQPSPKLRGVYWKWIPHHEIVEALHCDLAIKKWVVEETVIYLANHNRDMYCTMTVHRQDIVPPPGTKFMVGVSNSNAGKERLTIYTGCSFAQKGSFIAGRLVCGKHTLHTSAIDEIGNTAKDIAIDLKKVSKIYERLIHTKLEEPHFVDSLLARVGRSGICPWSRVGKIDALYRDPAKLGGSGTAWDLVRAFAIVSCRNTPKHQLSQQYQFGKLVQLLTKHMFVDATIAHNEAKAS